MQTSNYSLPVLLDPQDPVLQDLLLSLGVVEKKEPGPVLIQGLLFNLFSHGSSMKALETSISVFYSEHACSKLF